MVVTRSRPAGQGRHFGMVVLGSAGALRVTLVTSAGIRGTGWGPGVSSRTIMACSRGGKRQNKKSSKKYKKLSRPTSNVDAVLKFTHVHGAFVTTPPGEEQGGTREEMTKRAAHV